MTSHELADLLADHLRIAKERHIVWREVTFPDGGRADIYALRPWASIRDSVVYEVKATRADLMSDVNRGKYRRYLKWCHRLFFVCPAGMMRLSELPEGVGLVTAREGGFRVVRSAPRREIEWSSDLLISLLSRRVSDSPEREQRRLDERVVMRENSTMRPLVLRLGQEIARKVAFAEQVERGEIRTEVPDDRHAHEFWLHVQDAAGRAGLTTSSRDLERMAQYALAVMRHTEAIREVARVMMRLPYALDEELRMAYAPPPAAASARVPPT